MGEKKRKILIATSNKISIQYANAFAVDDNVRIIVRVVNQNEDLLSTIADFMPDMVFFPHWSWMIPTEVYESIPCIVFHTSDLPKGRGGSPLQNQIVAGICDSFVCALKVSRQIDTGDIYLKLPISLLGTADEIIARISRLIFTEMIPRILFENIKPIPQLGKATVNKRRTVAQSEIKESMTLEQVFRFIQMLDGIGYPKAFVNVNEFKMEITRASYKSDYVLADVKITMKERDV